MSVLSFRSLVRAVAQPRDWSTQDVADFYRAYDLLRRHGVNIGIDRGLTDKGEPWLVFFDAASQDVFLHMARIDDVCILVSDVLGINFKARSIPELIAKLDESVRDLVVERAERDSNVVMHPAARIIMAVSAVFLLFKFDKGGSAYAKGEPTTSTLDAVMRKQEAGLQARLQASIGRLLESVDTPAAIAATAGVLLTAELMRLVQEQDVREFAGVGAAVASEMADASALSLDEREAHVDAAAHASDSPALEDLVAQAIANTAAADSSLASDLAEIAHDVLKAVEGAIVGRAYAAERVEPMKLAGELSPVAAAPQVSSKDVPASPSATDMADAARQPASSIGVPTSAESGPGHLVRVPQSDTPVTEAVEGQQPADNVPTPIWLGGDIDMNDLVALSNQAGFYRRADMSSADTMKLLGYLYGNMSGMIEDEFDGRGNAMIELKGTAALSASQIGLWQGVMTDGTVLSIVGSVGVVDGLMELL